MNIYLTGFMGAGKTAVGKALAERLGFDFFDTDAETVHLISTTIADYMKRYGEPEFRKQERAALIKISREDCAVIATGGGTLLTKENVSIAHEHGLIVFVDAPFFECYRRIAGGISRPLARGKSKAELNAMYSSRRASYLAAADYTARGSGNIGAVVDNIMNYLTANGGTK